MLSEIAKELKAIEYKLALLHQEHGRKMNLYDDNSVEIHHELYKLMLSTKKVKSKIESVTKKVK